MKPQEVGASKQQLVQYNYIRKELDKRNYIKGFNFFSLDLVSDLLNDIILKTNHEINAQNTIEVLKERIENLNLEKKAIRYKMEQIYNENKELHIEVISLLNKKKSLETSENTIKKLNEENITLKFLVDELKNQLKKVQEENYGLKKKLEKLLSDLFEKTKNIKQLFEEQEEEEKNNLGHHKPITYQQFEENFFNLATIRPNIEISEPLNNENENTIFDTINDRNNLLNNNNNDYYYQNYNNQNEEGVLNLKSTNERLKNDLIDKENEINILQNQIKKYFNNDSNLVTKNNDNNILVDYLKNEIKVTKDKYENYMRHIFEATNIDNMKAFIELTGNNNKKFIKMEIENLYKQNKDFSITNQKLNTEINTLKKKIESNEELRNKIKELEKKNEEYEHLVFNKKFNLKFCSKNVDLQILKGQNSKNDKLLTAKNKLIRELTIFKDKMSKENQVLVDQMEKLKKENNNLVNENKLIKFEYDGIRDKINLINQNILSNDNKYNNQLNEINKKEEEKSKLIKSIKSLKNELESQTKNTNLYKEKLLLKDKEIDRLNEINKMLEIEVKMAKNT